MKKTKQQLELRAVFPSPITQIHCCPGVEWQKRSHQVLKDKGFRDLETCLAFVGQRDFSVQVLLLSFHLLLYVLFLSAIGGVPPLLSQAGYSSALVSVEQK